MSAWTCTASGAPRACQVAGVLGRVTDAVLAGFGASRVLVGLLPVQARDLLYGKAYCRRSSSGCSWELLAKAMSDSIRLTMVKSLDATHLHGDVVVVLPSCAICRLSRSENPVLDSSRTGDDGIMDVISYLKASPWSNLSSSTPNCFTRLLDTILFR